MVFRELEVSWENLRKKNIFYEGKSIQVLKDKTR